MLSNFKKYIGEKLVSVISTSEKNRNYELWKSFTSNTNINIHDTFHPKNFSIFKGKGKDFGEICIDEKFSLRDFCNILVYPNATLNIGKRVFFNNYCSINCLDKIEIGDDTLFGEGVKLYDHNHLLEKKSLLIIHKDQFSTSPIIIGKNCWLGSNVVILKGVTIGDNVVIGAGCVIYKNIPSNSIVKNNQSLLIEEPNGN